MLIPLKTPTTSVMMILDSAQKKVLVQPPCKVLAVEVQTVQTVRVPVHETMGVLPAVTQVPGAALDNQVVALPKALYDGLFHRKVAA